MIYDIFLQFIMMFSILSVAKITKTKSYFYIIVIATFLLITGPEFYNFKMLYRESYSKVIMFKDFIQEVLNSPNYWIVYTKSSFDQIRLNSYYIIPFILGSSALIFIYFAIFVMLDAMIGVERSARSEDKVIARFLIAIASFLLFLVITKVIFMIY